MTPVSPVLRVALPSNLQAAVWAETQPQYNTLPSIRSTEPGQPGRVTTRWRLTWSERWKLLWSGSLFIQVLTFGMPLMPLRPMAEEPTVQECL